MTEMKEWTHVDKTAWGPGPWQTEPDKVHFIDEETDLDCLMHRNGSGAWCGYVGVTEGHPYFEKDYDAVSSLEVHGGVTYAAKCQDTADESQGICHVPLPGRPHDVWWIGFDTAHFGDYVPKYDLGAFSRPGGDNGTYKDRSYVEREVRDLARQIADVANG